MLTYEFLSRVIYTVGLVGHRKNQFFIEALDKAKMALSLGLSDQGAMRKCEACRDLIHTGLQIFVPGASYYDPAAAEEYALLLDSVKQVRVVD